jgi:succinate-semialdehyde dehydrogenase/glutarate-semialdehyde dehydrogenase
MPTAINPATDLELRTYPDHPGPMVDQIIEKSHAAFLEWKNVKTSERAKMIARVGEVLLKNKEKLGQICTDEMGKLLTESIAEVEKCALACQFYAENAEKFLRDEQIKTEGQESFVTYKPLGVVLAVMPWNFPYWQVIRFAAPALCAGNAAVLKHASNVPGCAMALEETFKEAGLPENLFRTLLISSKEVSRVIENKLIQAVTITGSTKAGKEVAKKAGEVLKKVVLELGGSDPYLIMKDADLAMAAKVLVKGRLLNAGQSCISPKRLIVEKSVYADFTKLIEAEMKQASVIAPMARKDLRDELQEQIDKSLKQGATCLIGGKIPQGPGAYYPATLITDLKPGMSAFDEELFGPVVCLIPAANEEEMIKFANMSQYGLGGGIFSQNIPHARHIATERLETGGVFINDFLKSDPRLPFGGIKESGYGRELSHLGIKEFVNAKTIFIK